LGSNPPGTENKNLQLQKRANQSAMGRSCQVEAKRRLNQEQETMKGEDGKQHESQNQSRVTLRHFERFVEQVSGAEYVPKAKRKGGGTSLKIERFGRDTIHPAG